MSYDPCEEDPASTLLRPHLQVRKSTLSRRSNASLLGSFGIKYDEGVEGCKECVGGTLGTEQSSRIGAHVSHGPRVPQLYSLSTTVVVRP